MQKAVFLDRDGTLIIDKVYLNDPSKIEYLPGIIPGLRLLRDHGYALVVVTNQSGLARGIVDIRILDEIHRIIASDLAKEGIYFKGFYYAPYSVESQHPTRKPNPGMLFFGARDHSLNLSESWMVGDRMSDVEAGHRAGCRSVLLTGTENPADFSGVRPPEVLADDFLSACKQIVFCNPRSHGRESHGSPS